MPKPIKFIILLIGFAAIMAVLKNSEFAPFALTADEALKLIDGPRPVKEVLWSCSEPILSTIEFKDAKNSVQFRLPKESEQELFMEKLKVACDRKGISLSIVYIDPNPFWPRMLPIIVTLGLIISIPILIWSRYKPVHKRTASLRQTDINKSHDVS